MRRMIKWMTVLAIIWSGWWAAASFGVQRGIASWIDSGKDFGWQGEVSQAGFPFRIRSELRNVVLRDPKGDSALMTDSLAVSAPTYWPGDLTAELPQTPITVETTLGQLALAFTGAEAGVRLSPGTDLTLDALRAESGPWLVTLEDQEVVLGQALDVLMQQSDDQPLRYDVTFDADRLTPGKALRQPLRLDLEWPSSFDTFAGDLALTFDKPLDRHAQQGPEPQPRIILIRAIDLSWGQIAFAANGTLLMDSEGVPEGNLSLQLKNWLILLDLAQAAGALPPDARQSAEFMFRALAARAGSPDDLDVDLRFANGQMIFSGIPMGPAPRIRF